MELNLQRSKFMMITNNNKKLLSIKVLKLKSGQRKMAVCITPKVIKSIILNIYKVHAI